MRLTDFKELGVKSWLDLYELIADLPATIKGEEEIRFQMAKPPNLKHLMSNKPVPKRISDVRTYTVNLPELKARCFDHIYPQLPDRQDIIGLHVAIESTMQPRERLRHVIRHLPTRKIQVTTPHRQGSPGTNK